jgi:twitching motility protein PilI
MSETRSSLAELADRPFELLTELDRLCRQAAAGRREAAMATEHEWVGIGVRIGPHAFVVPREEVREILPCPRLARVPGAKKWLLGLANVRGQLLSVVDLHQLAGGSNTAVERSTRVVVVNHPEIPAGLMVDEVRGFRRFQPDEAVDERPDLDDAFIPFVTGGFRRGDEYWAVLRLQDLVESQLFLQAAE